MNNNLYADGNDPTANQPLYWIHPSGPETDVGILPLGFGAKIKACLDESFFTVIPQGPKMALAMLN